MSTLKDPRRTKSINNSLNSSFIEEGKHVDRDQSNKNEDALVTMMDEKFSPISQAKISETDTISMMTSKFMKRTIGLDNPGFYCYLNSAVQCVLSIPSIVDYFLSLQNPPDPFSQPYCSSIYQLIYGISRSKNSVFRLSSL